MVKTSSVDEFTDAAPAVTLTCMLIGDTPPASSNTARHLARLAYMLRKADVNVLTCSPGSGALLAPALCFESERDLADSIAEVTRSGSDRVFLYPAALNFGDCEQPGWFRRRLEEVRRLRFSFALGRMTDGLTLICEDPRYRFRTQAGVVIMALLGGLSRRRRVALRLRSGRMSSVLDFGIATDVSVPDPAVAEHAFLTRSRAAPERGDTARLTPMLCARAIELAAHTAGPEADRALFEDLRLLNEAARTYPGDTLPAIRLFRRQCVLVGEEASGPPASRAYDIANTPHAGQAGFGLPLTRFMMHIRAAMRLEDRFPLTSRAEARAFLTWYRERGPVRACGGILPEPMPLIEPPTATSSGQASDCTGLEAISALDNRPFPVPAGFLMAQECLPSGRFDLETPAGRIAWLFEQIVTRAGAHAPLKDLGDRGLDYMSAPVGGRAGNVSRFEFLFALHCRRLLRSGRDFLAPWRGQETRNWFRAFVLARLPGVAQFATGDARTETSTHQLDIVGLPRQATGIAVNFEMSKRALSDTGIPVQVRDAEAAYAAVDRIRPVEPRELNRSVALYHLNADRIPQALVSPGFAARKGLYNIGYLLWEFSRVPDAHRLALDMLDEIWVPTRFLQDTYSDACAKPVVRVGKGLCLPEIAPVSLSRFGVRQAGVTFLTCFDFHSSVARKNPLAAVHGFQSAFPDPRADVQLVVKTTPRQDGHWGDPEDQLGQIRRIARKDRRVHILAEYLPQDAFLSLIRSVDCLISPHRAEGFGYIPAYALNYGVPVVATDYSGVRDYCTPATSFPVPYRLVDVARDHAIFPTQGAQWADIEVDALAENLRKVAFGASAAKALAKAGQALIRSEYSIAALRARYLARLCEIGAIAETDLQICS